MGFFDKLKRSIQALTSQKNTAERYSQQQRLGGGAMGEVWLATDTLLNRPVAIKYLKATQSSLHKELFLAEAQMLARLNHPNITLIYDAVFDQKRNSFYLVMEYIEGKPLSALINEEAGLLPLETTLSIAIGVLQALQLAHDHGIVHRDVKPANIMLQKDEVKLTDFGVAGLISLLSDNAQAGMGSLSYMSPEQIRGGAIDGRADLYAVGVTLFELLSGGHLPFERPTRQAMIEVHLNEPPPDLRQFNPDIPLALEHAVFRLLAKEPHDRFPSAWAVIEVLRLIQTRLKLSQPHFDLLKDEARLLVGREEELKRIGAVWRKSREMAQPRLLVIQGKIGMGKSSLVTRFLTRQVIDRGFVGLAGRCNPSQIPYAPFAEVLAVILNKRLSPSASVAQIDLLLDHMPSLARLLNMTGPAQPSLLDQMKNPVSAQWQFFTTTLMILNELGPSIIFLEDAAFLDEASAAFIQFLIRQPQLPLLLIAAYRSNGQSSSWLDLFPGGEKEVITLLPLSIQAVKAILEDVFGGSFPEEAALQVKEQSRDNPLQFEEVARQLIASGELQPGSQGLWRYQPLTKIRKPSETFLPESVLNVFVRRIEKLSKPNRRALALAALIEPGAEFDLDVLVEILEGEPQQVVAQTILNEALAARLVRQVGEQRYIFHPVDLAETLAAELPEAELPTLHRRLAEILCQKQANPMLIGHHYERAGLPQEAAHYLELAAVNAASTNAVKTAIEYYNRVVDLKDSLSAYKALGNLYRQQGEWNYSLRAFQQALKLAQETNDTLAQAQIMNGMSFTLWLHDNYKEAHKLAEAVLRLANVPESEQAAAHSHLGMIAWLVGELAQAETWCEQSIRVLEQGSDKAHLAGAYNRLGLVHFSQGKLAEAYNLTLRSLKLREQLDDYWGQAYCLVNMGKVVTDQGDFEQAFSLFHSAQKLFEQVNSQDGLMILNASYGRALLFQKRYEEALPYFARARQIALKIGKRTAYGLSYIDLLQAQTYLALGQLETAKTALSEGLNLVQEADNREYIAIGLAIQAQVYAAEGNPALAEEIYHQAMALFEQIGSQTGLLRTWLAYAQFLAQQGQTEKAANLEQNSHAEAAKIGAYLS